ncbi:hypothetical protein BU25DRAFT_30355 [Macroventuria anomochaeta]|uniref:Uncharacterized protein n=1 Tax=Macroventuria anomochaeta TaxID=301207 RepID=A0ACB6S356_9PLEO|nr:uncharacterized protein BU25DRAFT_30355 [Macroventuria anomochaeta]KAF2628686.1 hypothetical protein BU25DRAFT_30355 [Macroventuria anomochaeta]
MRELDELLPIDRRNIRTYAVHGQLDLRALDRIESIDKHNPTSVQAAFVGIVHMSGFRQAGLEDEQIMFIPNQPEPGCELFYRDSTHPGCSHETFRVHLLLERRSH